VTERFLRAMTLCGALLLLAPGTANAVLVTITFDNGDYDPDIVSPGGEIHGPFDWLELGTRAAGFWAIDIGTIGGQFQLGHTHRQPSYGGPGDGYSESMHAWTDDLQGLYITIEKGHSFGVVSINYSLKEAESADPQMERYAWSYAVDDAQLLLTTSYDPSLVDVEGQWTAFSAPTAQWNPWFTRAITGFDDVTGVYVTQTAAQMKIDSIVLDIHRDVPLSPAAGSILALILAATGTAARRWLLRHSPSPSSAR